MAKEMMIVFVFRPDEDTENPESADPVLYFHPSWVSDTQKLALCGNIVGTLQFVSEAFARPRIVGLQSGKFALRYFGSFILAVGTDRNIPEATLEYRASLLSGLLRLYHCDIQTICAQFVGAQQTKNLSDKLYQIFETYLPILQYGGNFFHTIPLLKLPKSAHTIYLDATQTLQSCQQTKGVLGGVIMYHNKIVASHLPAAISKLIVLSDPLRLKTADPIHCAFHVPVGVHLLTAYISEADYKALSRSALRAQNAFSNNNSNLLPFTLKKKVSTNKEPALKRDKSLIFTNIPEEDSGLDQPKALAEPKSNFFKNLPTHLPLRFKNVTSKDLPESGFSSITFDEADSFPDFIGKTSVCSTPMTENKILSGNILSICAATCEELEQIDRVEEKPSLPSPKKETPKEATKKSPEFDLETNYVNNPFKQAQRHNSWASLHSPIKKFLAKRAPPPPPVAPISESDDDDSDSDSFVDDGETKLYHTITDPTFPVFNTSGIPISRSLFHDYLRHHYASLADTDRRRKSSCPKVEVAAKVEPKEVAAPPPAVKPAPPPPEVKPSNRKGLTLPLKSLNRPSNDSQPAPPTVIDPKPSMFDSPARRRKPGSLQLTPLMAKLTVLAMADDRSYASYDATPGMETLPQFKRRASTVKADEEEDGAPSNKDATRKVDLFVCGQQNTTMVLLLEETTLQRQEIVQALFDVCVSRLTKIENALFQALNLNVESGTVGVKGEGSYSFITVDSKWDTTQKVGPWTELAALEYMSADLQRFPFISEMTLRNEDNVIYGHQCGETRIFYQQSHAAVAGGLPPPSDIMSNVPSVTKRRLERDHGIMLF